MTAHRLKLTPVPKPRQTRRDKWLSPPRPCVARYRAFADAVREQLPRDIDLSGAEVWFEMPMPKSWSKKKRKENVGKPHRQKPDLSNLIKALEDAHIADDSAIWAYSALGKCWTDDPVGGILVKTGPGPSRSRMRMIENDI